jgi:hypothetical protein
MRRSSEGAAGICDIATAADGDEEQLWEMMLVLVLVLVLVVRGLKDDLEIRFSCCCCS